MMKAVVDSYRESRLPKEESPNDGPVEPPVTPPAPELPGSGLAQRARCAAGVSSTISVASLAGVSGNW
jgi:hypothetical protein